MEKKSFQWLLEHLVPPHDKICGCELLMADSAIFENGKPKSIIKTDQDGFLVSAKNKLNLQDLRRTFSIVVRDRKKENEGAAEPIGTK